MKYRFWEPLTQKNGSDLRVLLGFKEQEQRRERALGRDRGTDARKGLKTAARYGGFSREQQEGEQATLIAIKTYLFEPPVLGHASPFPTLISITLLHLPR